MVKSGIKMAKRSLRTGTIIGTSKAGFGLVGLGTLGLMGGRPVASAGLIAGGVGLLGVAGVLARRKSKKKLKSKRSIGSKIKKSKSVSSKVKFK